MIVRTVASLVRLIAQFLHRPAQRDFLALVVLLSHIAQVQLLDARHLVVVDTGSRRYICLTIPEGQYIDNVGDIDYEQLY